MTYLHSRPPKQSPFTNAQTRKYFPFLDYKNGLPHSPHASHRPHRFTFTILYYFLHTNTPHCEDVIAAISRVSVSTSILLTRSTSNAPLYQQYISSSMNDKETETLRIYHTHQTPTPYQSAQRQQRQRRTDPISLSSQERNQEAERRRTMSGIVWPVSLLLGRKTTKARRLSVGQFIKGKNGYVRSSTQ